MRILKNIFLALICCILFPAWIGNYSLAFTNSFFSVVCFILLYALLDYSDKQNYEKRMSKYTHVLGLLFSAMAACGFSLDGFGTVSHRSMDLLLAILLYAHIFALLLCRFWSMLILFEGMLGREEILKGTLKKIYGALGEIYKRPPVIMLFLLVCWLPCYIATFPGNFIYDAAAEFHQLENGFNGDFPMLHSFLITRILSTAYRVTGSYNAGIAVFTILQMLFLAGTFTHILYKFYQYKGDKIVIGIMTIYYALFPVVHILVTSTVRDVLFSGLLNYTVFLFWLMARNKGSFMHSVAKPVFLGMVLVLTLLARNNNAGIIMIIVLFVLSVIVWIWAGEGNRKGATVFMITAVGGYTAFSFILPLLCQPSRPAGIASSLSMLTQPIARAYLSEDSKFTEEERKEFEKFFGSDIFYVPGNADPTKFHFNTSGDSPKEFVKLWIKGGIKHPGEYLDAVLANTEQMWFPNSVVDGYKQAGIELYEPYEKCYFYFAKEIDEPGTRAGFLPEVFKFYEKIGLMISFEKIPVVSMLFSIGFQFWMVLNCFFYTAYRKCGTHRISLTILLGYALISACVPLVLLRYFAVLFFAFPMILIFTLQPEKLMPEKELREEIA